MKYKRIWMPYKTDFLTSLLWVSPSDNEDTKAADNKIEKLLSEGWSIVSTAPITESRGYDKNGHCNMNMPNTYGTDMVYTYTSGIEVFLVKE